MKACNFAADFTVMVARLNISYCLCKGEGGSKSKNIYIYVLVGISSKLLADGWPEKITSFEGLLCFQTTLRFTECVAEPAEPVVETSLRRNQERRWSLPVSPLAQRRREAHFSFISGARPPGRRGKDPPAYRQTLRNK